MSSARPKSSSRTRTSRTSTRRSTTRTSQAPAPAIGLRTIVQQRLLKDVFGNSAAKGDGWMILVVDGRSMRVVSTSIGMYDIMENHVSLVEDIDKKRAPFKDMGAIYLLSGTEESVDRLVADYGSSPLYGKNAFVYFLGPIPSHELDKIKQCKPLLKRLKALGEVNIDFMVKEERAYHLDMRSAFPPIYLRNARKIEANMADKLVTLCATLNEYPHIRYANDSATCSALARTFHLKMDEFLRNNDNWWYHGDSRHNDRARGTLLLLDRRDDCLSPFLHEFTYEAMVNDLLKIEDDKVTYESETFASDDGPMKVMEKDVLLNDNDKLWVELRSKHIADVVQILSGRIREMVNSDTSGLTQKSTSKPMSLTQMGNALKALPEYREVMSKLAQHMHLAHECLDQGTKLNALAELEQTLATGKRGTDDRRGAPKLADMVEEVGMMLEEERDPLARARLLMIFIVSQGGIDPQYEQRLFKAAKLTNKLENCVRNLEVLDIPIVSNGEQRKSGIGGIFGGGRLSSTGSMDEEGYSTSRYVPPIKDTLTKMCQGTLSIEEYPSVMPLPENSVRSSGTATSARNRAGGSSLRGSTGTSKFRRSSAAAAAASDAKGGDAFTGERQLVFVVGGMCYSELRSAREVMSKEGKEIIIGSTHFIKPNDFMHDISRLS